MSHIKSIKLFSYLVILVLLWTMPMASFAADKQAPKPFKPTTYPYPYPYDEDPCPTGKCSRANENPKQIKRKDRFGRDVDED